jgi:hypothetical protein
LGKRKQGIQTGNKPGEYSLKMEEETVVKINEKEIKEADKFVFEKMW